MFLSSLGTDAGEFPQLFRNRAGDVSKFIRNRSRRYFSVLQEQEQEMLLSLSGTGAGDVSQFLMNRAGDVSQFFR